MVEEAMLADPSIQDCVVLNRAKETSPPEFVAYIVSAGKFSPEQIQSHLQATLPSYLLPIAYVPLSKLPLTSTGQVDEQALATIEVIDSDLVQKWETELQSLPEIEQVAVVVQDYAESFPSLHLSDLLPNLKSAPSTSAATLTATVIHDTASDEESAPKQSAIASGGSLPEEPDAPTTLPEILQTAARQTTGDSIVYLQPDGVAIAQSYENLLEDAERILAGLRKLGLKPQDKVIFQLELNQDIIPAFWGCILGGFIPVIMGVAPSYTTSNNAVDKLCNVWQLLDSPLILTTESLQKSVQSLTQWLPIESFKLSAIEALRNNEPDKYYHPSKPHDPAFFNLTSGSTGMPKCISLTHWNLISRARGTNILSQHNQKDVILNWLPFDHIGSISDWHIRCVELGCKLIYATKEYILGRPLNWLDLIDKYRITHSWAPNFAYALIYDALKQEPKHNWDLSCVKSLLTAGEAVSSTAVKDFIGSLAIYGFKQTAIRPAFGMAEMGSGITYYQPTKEHPLLFHTVDKSSLSGSIKRVNPEHPNCSTFTDLGAVIPSVTIRIVDKENSLLSEDTIGYLQVKGDAVFSGYYKNPEVNKEVFVEDGWFNTGDLGFISNRHLVVTGRAKETIIINGANYYSHEIE
ncbi:MAG TPA: peptide synthetase, partial [Cyanobacteria bacterium UBA11049]|nr:peptide synthetase [Cyanobacteria bacterium UBA11049]